VKKPATEALSVATPLPLADTASAMESDRNASIDFRVVATSTLDERSIAPVLALFRASYRAANEDYLRASFARLPFLATASAGGALIGFALGEMRQMDLPRLPQQAVALAGICCVDPRFRRRGLFRELESRAFATCGVVPGRRVLYCGRVAHPASFRTMTANPTHIPKRGASPTAWQREIGAIIAETFGVKRFDGRTFTCIGNGSPVGYPIMEMETRPEEWEVFAAVDRSRGDSLLGLCWMPDAPRGW
jgi:hypothetical protein